MLEITTERRLSNRRSPSGGGRRATDPPGRPSDLPTCPVCRKTGVALLAGESDGGWWFVCVACDHLWDQRRANGDDIQDEGGSAHVAGRADRGGRAPSFWRRLAFRSAASFD